MYILTDKIGAIGPFKTLADAGRYKAVYCSKRNRFKIMELMEPARNEALERKILNKAIRAGKEIGISEKTIRMLVAGK